MTGVVIVFSGLIIPLPLFPDWLQPLLYWQPFRGLADVPYRIYGGNIIRKPRCSKSPKRSCGRR